MGKTRTEASRAERKAKKRAAEDAVPDLPDTWTTESDLQINTSAEQESKKRKRDGNDEGSTPREEKESKKERKRRRKEAEANAMICEDASVETTKEKKSKKMRVADEAADVENVRKAVDEPGDSDTEMTEKHVTDVPKKSKKERKAERKAKEAAAAATGTSTATTKSTTTANGTEINGATEKGTGTSDNKEEKKSKKNNRNRDKKRKGAKDAQASSEDAAEENASLRAARFIVFVGQLPFTATKESVEQHFASIKPKSVRVPTEKGQKGKAKGYAFVEFEGYDHMKTCLKLFHHSLFNDGISAAREINVNLTAGGGGNTKERKEKIVEKNQKLDEERSRRRQEEQKAKLIKRAEGIDKDAIDESAIHPSRRGRVPIMK